AGSALGSIFNWRERRLISDSSWPLASCLETTAWVLFSTCSSSCVTCSRARTENSQTKSKWTRRSIGSPFLGRHRSLLHWLARLVRDFCWGGGLLLATSQGKRGP